MHNINKRIPEVTNLLKHTNFSTKISIFMSTKTAGDDYDEYEDNYTYSNLNPIIVKGYVREVSPEALVYKQYGMQNMGAKEILCDSKYKNLFENCNLIEIDSDKYMVFKEGTNNRTLISDRPNKLIRVVVTRSE